MRGANTVFSERTLLFVVGIFLSFIPLFILITPPPTPHVSARKVALENYLLKKRSRKENTFQERGINFHGLQSCQTLWL
jgi:hypothetical protein